MSETGKPTPAPTIANVLEIGRLRRMNKELIAALEEIELILGAAGGPTDEERLQAMATAQEALAAARAMTEMPIPSADTEPTEAQVEEAKRRETIVRDVTLGVPKPKG